MAERHPKVHMVIVEATSTSLEPQLADRLDLAVVNLPVPGDDLIWRPLFDEDLLLIVPTDHPLADRGEVDLTETDGIELLMPAPGTALRDEIEKALAGAGVVWKPKAELDGVRLIASLAFEGHGPAVLPASGIPDWLRGNWRSVSVRGLGRRSVGLALRRRGRPAAPARALMQVLDDVVETGTRDFPGLHPPGAV